MEILEILRHLPEHLQIWATNYGAGLYIILAVVLFAETGLVVTPFLPGDSLLFATGAVLATGLPDLNLPTMCVVLVVAVLCGDFVNYSVGRWAAPRLFGGKHLRWLNAKHLQRTKEFYTRHGGKTIMLARFFPIVRTYAPFVAGVSGISRQRFAMFSFMGATLWIVTFLNLGFFFGGIAVIKRNFELVISAIVVISLVPVALEFLRGRRIGKPA